MFRSTAAATCGLALVLASLGGCPLGGLGGGLGGGGFFDDDEITVRVINTTSFDIDPRVEYGRSEFRLFDLGIGLLAPGEVVEVDLDCEDALLLTTTDSVQLGFAADFVLLPLPLFELDFDYFCGELVEFEFVGNGQNFDVFVFAGGENIY